MMKLNSYYTNIILNSTDFTDKETNIYNTMTYFFARTSEMFKWDNLPETIDQDILELYLQTNGYVGLTEYNGELYVYNGSIGKMPDEYYRPTTFIINNPYQNFNKECVIGEDLVLIKSDSMLQGLQPLISKYSTLLAENDVSIRIGMVNTRKMNLMTAKDAAQKKACDIYENNIEAGKISSVLDENFILDGIRVQPFGQNSQTNSLIQYTEIQQYLMGNLWQELGIKGNFNNKRENISENESKIGNETLLPLIDNMLRCREKACEEINAMFGTNITVEKNSAWKMTEEASEEIPEEKPEEKPED